MNNYFSKIFNLFHNTNSSPIGQGLRIYRREDKGEAIKMNYERGLLFTLFFSAIIFVVQSSFTKDKNEIKFIQPKDFPKPFYDFSKNKITEAGFKLGRKLFYDPILSKDSSTSCNSCHLQFTAFTHVDHAFSHGIGGQTGTRNSPALQNLAWQKFFMWDGGVTNLEMQPINPIENPIEMGNKMKNVVEKLNHSHRYKSKFYQAFGDSTITGQRLLKALSQFLAMLESVNSEYDKVKRGEEKFTVSEENGFRIFKKNCAACHTGNLFTDGAFHNTGLSYDAELKDIGRMKITHNKSDSLKFKTPTLRNIAASYPYMHDGRFKKLEQVIDFYTEDKKTNNLVDKILKQRIILSVQEKKDVIAFLQTLTDKEFLFDLRFRDYVNE